MSLLRESSWSLYNTNDESKSHVLLSVQLTFVLRYLASGSYLGHTS
jgi:hypothetical protein